MRVSFLAPDKHTTSRVCWASCSGCRRSIARRSGRSSRRSTGNLADGRRPWWWPADGCDGGLLRPPGPVKAFWIQRLGARGAASTGGIRHRVHGGGRRLQGAAGWRPPCRAGARHRHLIFLLLVAIWFKASGASCRCRCFKCGEAPARRSSRRSELHVYGFGATHGAGARSAPRRRRGPYTPYATWRHLQALRAAFPGLAERSLYRRRGLPCRAHL